MSPALASRGPRHQNCRMSDARELDWLQDAVGILSPADRTLISVSGDDAHEWLQGQITNQSEGAKPGDSVYGFILTLKDRVMADVWAYFQDDGVLLEVPDAVVDALMERLDRYIIMEDVDLEHRPASRILLAQGPRSGDVMSNGWPSDRLGTGGRAWVIDEAELDAKLEHASGRAVKAMAPRTPGPRSPAVRCRLRRLDLPSRNRAHRRSRVVQQGLLHRAGNRGDASESGEGPKDAVALGSR